MKRIPLKVIGTGGNCQAWYADLPNGWQIAITDEDEPSLPGLHSQCVDVGIFRDKGLWMDQVAIERVRITSALAHQDLDHLKRVCETIAWQVASKHCKMPEEDRDVWTVTFRFTSPPGVAVIGAAMQRWAQEQATFLASQDLSPLPEGTLVEVAAIERRV